jgi:hypothetical protein
MKKAMILASAAMIGIALLSGGAGAQGTPQTVELVKVDVHKLAAGYPRVQGHWQQRRQ